MRARRPPRRRRRRCLERTGVDALAALQASADAGRARHRGRARAGSTPRDAGTRMIVTRGRAATARSAAAISSSQAIGIARDALGDATPAAQRLRRFPLGAASGNAAAAWRPCCSSRSRDAPSWLAARGRAAQRTRAVRRGRARRRGDDRRRPLGRHRRAMPTAIAVRRSMPTPIALARDAPARRRGARSCVHIGADGDAALVRRSRARRCDFDVVLFGNGHVGRALVQRARRPALPCHAGSTRATTISRATCPPTSRSSCTDAPEAEVDAAPPGAYFLVMTHNHALDERIAERILERDDFALPRPDRLAVQAPPVRAAPARARHAGRALRAMTCPIGVAGDSRQGAGRDRGRGRRARFSRCASALAARPASRPQGRRPRSPIAIRQSCRSGSA